MITKTKNYKSQNALINCHQVWTTAVETLLKLAKRMRILNLLRMFNKNNKDCLHLIDIYKIIFPKEWKPFRMKRMKTWMMTRRWWINPMTPLYIKIMRVFTVSKMNNLIRIYNRYCLALLILTEIALINRFWALNFWETEWYRVKHRNQKMLKWLKITTAWATYMDFYKIKILSFQGY